MERVLDIAQEQDMEALGVRLATACRADCVIHLQGDLGAGKTTLVRGFLRGLGYAGVVKSPTYTLVEPYEIAGRSLYHIDLYRLSDPGELEYLGVWDLGEGASVYLVEWPERGEGVLPPPDLVVHIDYRDEGRRVRLDPRSPQGEALLARLGCQP